MSDIQYDRGQKVRMQLDQIVNTLEGIPVGASLVWLWVWDLVRDKYNTFEFVSKYNDYVITSGVTLDVIWNKLWESPPTSFTLEYGAEYIDEAITDWMIDNEFLNALEDDDWLNEEKEDLDEVIDDLIAEAEDLKNQSI